MLLCAAGKKVPGLLPAFHAKIGFDAIQRKSAPLFLPRYFSCTPVVNKVQAAKYRTTPYKTKPLTYEMALNPHFIGLQKGWNSWNTANLSRVNTNMETTKMTVWDVFIRKFIYGTWHNLFVSEVIIKRRYNAVYIAGVVQQTIPARKMYFLIGYTEEFLSFLLKCPVKMELQSVNSKKDVVYIYI